ncbi:MAG: RNA polymerase sigma-54 factor [Deltaproteobacteria bacterium]|nr:MAG: RNA polymerase sigma-54 factor [Deltaproteobacteria bacterium]
MALHMRQEQRMSQQLVMTQQLQQAIKLLQLSRIELQDLVHEELLENPMLEESGESDGEAPEGAGDDRGEAADGVEMATEPVAPADASDRAKDDFDWEAYLESRSYAPALPSMAGGSDELPGIEATVAGSETLAEHLLWQAKMGDFSPVELEIAEHLVQDVDGAGYLRTKSVATIAREIGTSTLRVEQVLRKLQQLDPLAVGSRTLAEALWIQIRAPDHPIEDPLVAALVAKHLGNLERRAYQEIARDLGEPLEEIYEAAKIIMSLEPRPARGYADEAPQYVVPDVFIQQVGDDYVVTLNDEGLPRLRVSNYYRAAMADDPKAREYVTERLRSARWLIRSIEERQRTILKVTKSILKLQREFFDKGIEYLKPMVLRDVAEDIDMHESTVSRVTTNKYVHTPRGTFELKYFFNAGVSRNDGSDVASEAVRSRIKAIIAAENPRKPLSDQKIVEILAGEGIEIARRTVAKYREQLGILSSSKRRRMF